MFKNTVVCNKWSAYVGETIKILLSSEVTREMGSRSVNPEQASLLCISKWTNIDPGVKPTQTKSQAGLDLCISHVCAQLHKDICQ